MENKSLKQRLDKIISLIHTYSAKCRLAVGVLLLLSSNMLTIVAPAISAAAIQPATQQFTQPCGNAGTPGPIQHVIWIWMENESYSNVIGSKNAPYQTSLANQCGNATNMHNESHGSLDNYIAATNGQNILNTAFTTDCSPNLPAAICTSPGPSIFSQIESAGLSWRSYDEDMPSNCYTANAGNYAPRHNPAVYDTSLTDCAQNDVPMGTASTQVGQFYTDVQNGNLPSFSFITPNLIDDSHNSGVTTGDTWLSNIIPDITNSPNYQSGNTAIFITNDEGGGSDAYQNENCSDPTLDLNQPSCHIPTIVVSPYTHAGTVDSTFYTHYSMLRTTEELLGLPLLNSAQNANSMAAAFNLGPVANNFAPPSAPANLTATAINSGEADLSWNASTPGTLPISGYEIIRNGQVIATASGNATSYADKSAIAGSTYSYSVAATDGVSNISPDANATSISIPASNNLLPNPGFENWANGSPVNWYRYYGATTLAQSSDAHSGSYSIKIGTSSATTTPAGINAGAGKPIIGSVTAGTTYTASCWVKASQPLTLQLSLHEVTPSNASAAPYAITSFAVPDSTNWYQMSVQDTMVTTGDALTLFIYYKNAIINGPTFEVDDCVLSTSS